MIKLNAGGATDVGAVRTENQDEFSINENVYVVADGMGGHLGGEVASSLAVESFNEALPQETAFTTDDLISAVRTANTKVYERALQDSNVKGMGTTITALTEVAQDDETRIAIVHVGDSRAYLLRDGMLQQITNDHSWVEDMVRTGQLSEAEAQGHPRRNILTRALGVDETLEPDVIQVLPLKGDRFLLCSDGLVRELTDDQIASVLRRLADPSEAARDVVKRAREHGGQDNITVLVVDVVESDIDPDEIAKNATGSDVVIQTPVEPAIPTEQQISARAVKRNQPTQPVFTIRVVAFVFTFLLIIGAALLIFYSYETNSYFVTLKGNQIVIYKGRPNGSLGLKPKLAENTYKTLADIPTSHDDEITKGKLFTSKADADQYVQNLIEEEYNLNPTTTTTIDHPAPPQSNSSSGAGAGSGTP